MVEIRYLGKCLLAIVNKKKILVVGDLHLGYEEYLNRTGVYITRQMFKEMINYFDKVFEKIGKVDEVVLLGDVKHDFGTIMKQEWDDVLGLFNYLEKKCKKIVITKGNHDTILEPIIRKKKPVAMKNYYIVDKFCFVHGDKKFKEMNNKKIRLWIMGHGHPAVKISDKVKVEKYKCFLVGKFKRKHVVVMPSFFEGSGGSDPRENNLGLAWDFNFSKFRVKAVSDQLEILDFGILGKL